MICQAKRINDEVQCHRCRTAWSINDERPDCLTVEQYNKRLGKETLEHLKNLMLDSTAQSQAGNKAR